MYLAWKINAMGNGPWDKCFLLFFGEDIWDKINPILKYIMGYYLHISKVIDDCPFGIL
jgi:hypothetical protein